MTTRYSRKRIGAGLSLVELLVVMALVLLLVMILLPALGSSRESARNVMCMSQQRQLGLSAFEHMRRMRSDVLPSLHDLEAVFPEQILVCPSDPQPDTLIAGAYGVSDDVQLSYNFNSEYELYEALYSQIEGPARKAYLFDGLMAHAGFFNWQYATATPALPAVTAGPALASNGAIARYDLAADAIDTVMNWYEVQPNGKAKMRIIHVPPGRRTSGNPQIRGVEMLVGLPAWNGHQHHGGDFIGAMPDGGIGSIQKYVASLMVRRHLGNRTGNVLMLDGHVESVPALTAEMFLDPDGFNFAISGGGNGDAGSAGNDNAGGNDNGNGGGAGGEAGEGDDGNAWGYVPPEPDPTPDPGPGNGNGNGNGKKK